MRLYLVGANSLPLAEIIPLQSLRRFGYMLRMPALLDKAGRMNAVVIL